jgi:hypothetical protein
VLVVTSSPLMRALRLMQFIHRDRGRRGRRAGWTTRLMTLQRRSAVATIRAPRHSDCVDVARARQGKVNFSMQPATMVCDYRTDSASNPCAQEAVVRNVRYEYQTLFALNAGPLVQELVATHYEIECPTCGRRTKMVAA